MLPTWNETGIALANHLWQSTVFAVSVGLLTLLFRRNGAAVRYRLWLIASIKFLVPFSLFVALGSLLHWSPVHPAAASEVPALVQHFSQPFTPVPMVIAEPSIAKPATGANASIGIAFASVWFGGAGVVLLLWFVRWAKLVRIVRKAQPLDHLDPLEGKGIRILSSPVAMEPGVFGIVRPALLLPDNIDRNLSVAQLKSVIAHEMVHVRRRDNLVSAMHTVVEALFWFHPLVWWLGNRLIDERERACDEAVLQSGHHPVDYAEGILKVCKSNVMTPACLAGVSGSNLRKRIEVIMENRGTLRLNHGRKLLLIVAGAVVLVGPIFAGMMKAAQSPVSAVRETQLAAPSQNPAPIAQQATTAPAVPADTKTGAVRAGASAIGGYFFRLNDSTNNFRASGETTSAALQAGTRQSNFVVSMTEPYSQDRQVALLEAAPASPTGQAVNDQQKWLDDVSIIISDEERKAYQQLPNDEQRQKFIVSFWLRRDPTPGTPANEFKEEYDKRIAYANEHFTTQSGVPGSKTDRGKMYILNGPPDAILPRSNETNNSGVFGAIRSVPIEMWNYRRIDGKGDNLVYEFVDKQMNGNYTLEYYPSDISK